MDCVKRGYKNSKIFLRSVIEWQSTFTALYLMLINAGFWWCVYYISRETQLKALISLASIIFAWDVLLSSSHERSILVHLVLLPFHNIIRTVSILLALFSAQCLLSSEIEKACWVAYSTVVLLLVDPVLRYQRVSERIFSVLCNTALVVKSAFYRFIVVPLLAVYRILSYILLLKWLSVFYDFLKNKLIVYKTKVDDGIAYVNEGICRCSTATIEALYTTSRKSRDGILFVIHSLQDFVFGILKSIRDSIIYALYSLKHGIYVSVAAACNSIISVWVAIQNAIRNTVFVVVRFVRTTIQKIIYAVTSCLLAIKNHTLALTISAKRRILNTILAVKNCIVTSWIRATTAVLWVVKSAKNWVIARIIVLKYSIVSAFYASGRAISRCFYGFINLVKSFFVAIKIFILQGLCKFRSWTKKKVDTTILFLKHNVIYPIGTALYAVIRFLRYWLCAYWWKGLQAWLKVRVGQFLEKSFNYLCYGFVYIFYGYWLKSFGRYLKTVWSRFTAVFYRVAIVPFKRWVKARMEDLVCIAKKVAHALAVAIRDSVLWPLCMIFANLMKQIYAYIRAKAIQPLLDYVYQKYKIVEDYALIHFIGPILKVIVDNIPEKSPFCEDSDTELAELLPDSIDEESNTDGETGSEILFTPSRSNTPLTDERDFLRGLKFPTVDASESSDDELDLKKRSIQTERRKYHAKVTIPKDPEHGAERTFSESERNSPSLPLNSQSGSRNQSPSKLNELMTPNFECEVESTKCSNKSSLSDLIEPPSLRDLELFEDLDDEISETTVINEANGRKQGVVSKPESTSFIANAMKQTDRDLKDIKVNVNGDENFELLDIV